MQVKDKALQWFNHKSKYVSYTYFILYIHSYVAMYIFIILML